MKKKNKEMLVSPILMWIIVIIGIVLLQNIIPNKFLFYSGIIGSVILVFTFIFWIVFFISSIRVHRKAANSVSRIDKVVKKGVYKIVRHPIYTADIVLAIGVFFLIPTLKVLFSVIWLVIILSIWMVLEEKALIKKFGKDYKDYMKEVPRIIPKFYLRR